MNKTVWKYELNIVGKWHLKIPEDSEILSVQTQNGVPCMWVLVDKDREIEERYFEIFGTGHEIPVDIGIDRIFIGTFQIREGALVFHLFERLD